jgi:hypothetical protein
MSKAFSIFLTLGLAGLACALLFPLIGAASVLIPAGYGLMFLGAIGASITLLVNLVRNATA